MAEPTPVRAVAILAHLEETADGAEAWQYDITRPGHHYYTACAQLAAVHVHQQTGRQPTECGLALAIARSHAGRPFEVRPMRRPVTPARPTPRPEVSR